MPNDSVMLREAVGATEAEYDIDDVKEWSRELDNVTDANSRVAEYEVVLLCERCRFLVGVKSLSVVVGDAPDTVAFGVGESHEGVVDGVADTETAAVGSADADLLLLCEPRLPVIVSPSVIVLDRVAPAVTDCERLDVRGTSRVSDCSNFVSDGVGMSENDND